MPRRQFQYDPEIGYKFIPGLKIRVQHEAGGYLFKTNSLGFRSDKNFLDKKFDNFNKKRILVFGDSYTAGDGVSNGERYSDLLESELQDVEVYNFGLPGTGTDQQYLAWQKYAKNMEYDLLIIALQVENIRRIVASHREYKNINNQTILVPKPYFKFKNNKLELFNVPVPKEYKPSSEDYKAKLKEIERGGDMLFLREFIKNFGPKAKTIAQKITKYQPLKQYDKSSNSSWILMQKILEEWCSHVTVPVIIFTIPIYQYIEKDASAKAYQTRFKSLNNSNKVFIHDPLDDFHQFPKSKLRDFRFDNDDHPTTSAHKVLASSLARAIRNIKF